MYGTGDYSSNFLSKSYMNINVYGSLGILIIRIEVHLIGFEDVQLEMHDVVGILHGALQTSTKKEKKNEIGNLDFLKLGCFYRYWKNQQLY